MVPTKQHSRLIYPLETSGLDSVPFHSGCQSIDRIIADKFPVHLAIHVINHKGDMPPNYVTIHKHETPEINIVLGNLKYRFLFDDEKYEVQSPSAIWIPSNLLHSANLISGVGYYVCMILSGEYHAIGRTDENG